MMKLFLLCFLAFPLYGQLRTPATRKADSLRAIAAVDTNFRLSVKTYFRLANAAGVQIEETQKLALKHGLKLEYIHCVSGDYERYYSQYFEQRYKQATGQDLPALVKQWEKEALITSIENYKGMPQARKDKLIQNLRKE